MFKKMLALCLGAAGLALTLAATAAPLRTSPAPTLEAVERKAFDFFWRQSDPKTGLTKDRAVNTPGKPDTYTVASTAATGYALAALPVGASHGWVSRRDAYARALKTLRFVHDTLPNTHGFYYHFIDVHTGARAWKCELSSIDTALLLMGARVAGAYWPGTAVQTLADDLTRRADWRWMQTDGGAKPEELAPSMGWHPEKGFIDARWQGYNEAAYLYWLALGTPQNGLTPAAWDAWKIQETTLESYPVFGGAEPLFMAQMAAGYFDVRGMRDRQGRDWWAAWHNAHLADHAYCARHPENKTYAEGFWGINASDQPGGYGADSPEDGHNTGTVAPTAMLASVMFTPALADTARRDLWQKHGDRLWGRYGFSNAFNVDKDWYDPDVIGIDLGMMLLAVENARTGLVWRLIGRDPVAQRGLRAAGFHPAVPVRKSVTAAQRLMSNAKGY